MTATPPHAPLRLARNLMALVIAAAAIGASATRAEDPQVKPRMIEANVQVRPGGERKQTRMRVDPVPVDPPLVSAEEASLPDDDLVLGVVIDGEAMAYPIRFLSLSEVVNSRAGSTPIAPTW